MRLFEALDSVGQRSKVFGSPSCNRLIVQSAVAKLRAVLRRQTRSEKRRAGQLAKRGVVVAGVAGDGQHVVLRPNRAFCGEASEGGQQLAPRQVSCSAENDKDARLGSVRHGCLHMWED